MVITLGAGSISSVGEPLIELLSQADRSSADAKEPR
jgi:hypothetical protein